MVSDSGFDIRARMGTLCERMVGFRNCEVGERIVWAADYEYGDAGMVGVAVYMVCQRIERTRAEG